MSISDLAPGRKALPLVPPEYCQYVREACDQTFHAPSRPQVFFAYASQPTAIASTISEAIRKLKVQRPDVDWRSWEVLDPRGQVIFCRICGSMRSSATLVADVTTLNFNLMFEIGVGIGLGMPVLTIRDVSLSAEQRSFREIGLLDTLGFVAFTNSDELAASIASNPFPEPLPNVPVKEFRDQPIYLLQSPTRVDGSVALSGALKKSRIKFRSFDSVETPRLSLHEARRQVAGSKGIVADLIATSRDRAQVHNARSAFIAGMALAQEKAVLMLQEEMHTEAQPIDYRDIVKTYRSSQNVPGLTRDFLADVVALMQEDDHLSRRGGSVGLLTSIDLGDVAAENEIRGLQHYFVTTGQSVQARQGHARLVIGRKGAGKTAIFYDVREGVKRGHERLVIDLKPDGHQFLQLREALLDRMGTGLKEHTMVAFWRYIILSEIARFALDRDRAIAGLDTLRFQRYETLAEAYGPHDPGRELDFSQRLLYQVDRVTRRLGTLDVGEMGAALTEVLYMGEDRALRTAVGEYLREKEAVWLLVDNLDKGWPVRGASDSDILIVRALLEATRKLQRDFNDLDIDFHSLVFLRSDIHEFLVEGVPDKGKDSVIRLDWEDPKVFEQIVMRRLAQGIDVPEDFTSAWSRICVPLVGGESSFEYIIDRTLMRPRNLLRFIRHAVDVAMNRGNERIMEDDLLQAEKLYSSDVLTETAFEVADTHPELEEVLYAFEGSPTEMPMDEVADRLETLLGLDKDSAKSALDVLLWFGVLGVRVDGQHDARYAYEMQGNLRRLRLPLQSGEALLVIHPAFRSALQNSSPVIE